MNTKEILRVETVHVKGIDFHRWGINIQTFKIANVAHTH